MKKIVTLFAAIMLLSFNLMATEVYPLTIGGVDVTSDNANDFYGDGTVWYDADNNRLYLSNADMADDIWYHPAWADDSEFRIGILGHCVIDYAGTSMGAIYIQAQHVYIEGFGTEPSILEVKSTNTGSTSYAIKAFGGPGNIARNLTISNIKQLKATSASSYAIECSNFKVNTYTTIEAIGADGKAAVKNGIDPVYLIEHKLVYSTKANGLLPAGHKIIIAPEAFVQEYEGVLINGKKPNNYTLNDVFENEAGDTWDPVKNVLTLKGDYYPNADDVALIDFSVPATIVGEGANKTLTCSSSYPVIHTTENLTITSGAGLYLSSNGPCAIDVEPIANDIQVTFDKAYIENMGSSQYSIQKTGSSLNAVNIAFNLSYVEDMHNVNGISGYNLSGCAFEDTNIDLDGGKFVVINDPACDYGPCPEPSMIRITTDSYPVMVSWADVYPLNMHDVLGDGMVSYDPTTKTLTFKDGASINTGSSMFAAVTVIDQDLTIVFEGSPAEFLGSDYECIKMDATDKKLTIVSKPCANNGPVELLSDNANLLPVISAVGCDVEFKGVNPFIVASQNSYLDAPVIKARNLYVNAPLSLENKKASSSYDALDVTAIELGTNMVLDPALDKLTFNPYSKQVQWKTSSLDKILAVDFIGAALIDDVKMTIAGVKVSKANADDILGNGQISYDEINKKLTLNNAHLTIDNGKAVYAQGTGVDKLTIEVKGQNVITCNQSYGFDIETETEFVGVGDNPYLKIDVEDDHSGYRAINIFAEKLTIKNLALAATVNHAANSGLAVGTTFGTLVVDNADLRVAINDLLYPLSAIMCMALDLKNGSVLRYDEPAWPMITWTGTAFDGTDLSRIWIGKNSTFPTDAETVTGASSSAAQKILRDGQILILRDGAIYTITGARVE